MTTSKDQPQLSPRLEPRQERAKASVDAILAAAAELLDEVGMDGFNTNLLAVRAGVRVRTVYRYFPNKYAVIVALTRKLAVAWDEWLKGYYEALADPQSDWCEAIATGHRDWLRKARREPGSLSVLQAAQATPELRQLHHEIFEDMCRKLVDALESRELGLPRTRLMAIARAIVSAENAATDLYYRLPPREAKLFIEEVDRFQFSYLETYLGSSLPTRDEA